MLIKLLEKVWKPNLSKRLWIFVDKLVLASTCLSTVKYIYSQGVKLLIHNLTSPTITTVLAYYIK
jgi:hypothetical protein